jgi:Phage integrase family
MARPRIYVRVIEKADGTLVHVQSGGREVHGLSYNRSNRSYYNLKSGSDNRIYHGTDVTKAVGSFKRFKFDPDDYNEQMRDSELKAEAWETLTKVMQDSSPKVARKLVTHAQEASGAPTKQKLSDCLAEWTKWKRADRCKEREWIEPVQQRFRRFIKCIGNVPISKLTPEDFIKWQLWVTKNKHDQRNPNHWSNRHHQYVVTVLRLCKSKNPSWRFPANFLDWATSYEGSPYSEDDACAEPMPDDIFKRLLAHADKMASATAVRIDTKEFSEIGVKHSRYRRAKRKAERSGEVCEINEPDGTVSSETGKALRQNQLVESTTRRGLQFRAMLLFGCQAGFGFVDCSQLMPKDIKTENGLTYAHLPRTKSVKKIGQPVDRRIPMLPSTIQALRALAKFNNGSYIFKNDHGGPLNPSSCSKEFEKFCKGAGVSDWTFKHLRNVGSNLADEHDLSSRMIDRFHGRVIKGAKKSYLVKTRKPEYLISLVNLIGAEHFDGEQVGR